LVADDSLNKEYLPIEGLPAFTKASFELLYSDVVPAERVAITQSISGTGGLRVGAEFLAKYFPVKTILVSDPSWGNHGKVFSTAGLTVKKYRYYDADTLGLDFAGLKEDLEAAEDGSIVLLHAVAHNPTGIDPTQDQWKEICELCKKKNLFPFFDCAYQGFATGDLDADTFAFRYFAKQGVSFMLAQSYAKNMGLYGERVGTTSIVCETPEIARACWTQLKSIIRGMFSNPPRNGAYIVHKVLTTPDLRATWYKEVSEMAERIKAMRAALKAELLKLSTPGNWDHITNQIGMFSYTGLTKQQVSVMESEFHIYMTPSGRMSMAGVNTGNVAYVAKAMDQVIRKHPAKI
jgi:aspartate aminotransferase